MTIKPLFGGEYMSPKERKELLNILIQDYLYQKERDNELWQKEHSCSYGIALGKLQGLCVALNLDFEETKEGIKVFTQGKRKLVTEICL